MMIINEKNTEYVRQRPIITVDEQYFFFFNYTIRFENNNT